jgi:DnaJ-domain-containing protein 1
MKNTRQKMTKHFIQGGRILGEVAWDWLKQQPPVQKQIKRVEKQIENTRQHVKYRWQLAEEEFWQWVNQLEAEGSFQRPIRSGPSLTECYQLLGVSPHTSWSEIKKAWREKMRACHPDQFAQNPQQQALAEVQARKINEAFQRLKDLHSA